MIGQLFAQRGNLFGCERAGAVAPFASLVSHDIGNLFVSQSFVPRLHDSGAVLLAFNFNRALQTFEYYHAHASRAASCKFGTGKRRILTRHALTIGLMTGLTIRRENLLAAIVGRYFRRLLAASRTRHCFLCRRRRAHRVEPATAEVARVTAEIRATKKNRQSVDRDEPNRERLGTDARFAFFTLNSSVHLLDVGLFAVIHSLSHARRLFRFFVHCDFHFAGAGDPAAEGPGDTAGDAAAGGAPPADLASLSGCD